MSFEDYMYLILIVAFCQGLILFFAFMGQSDEIDR